MSLIFLMCSPAIVIFHEARNNDLKKFKIFVFVTLTVFVFMSVTVIMLAPVTFTVAVCVLVTVIVFRREWSPVV